MQIDQPTTGKGRDFLTSRRDGDALPAAFGGSALPWYAVHVRSNQERVVSCLLEEKGYSVFLPLKKTNARRTGVRHQEGPLFPGYVFCQFDAQDRGPIVTITPVVKVIGIGRTPVPVEAAEIAAVHTILDSGSAYVPWPYVGVGERVRITAGPLEGVAGVLDQEKGGGRVIVSVELIQRSVAVEVDRAWIAPLQARSGNRTAPRTTVRAKARAAAAH